jgi:hypothetical protein
LKTGWRTSATAPGWSIRMTSRSISSGILIRVPCITVSRARPALTFGKDLSTATWAA